MDHIKLELYMEMFQVTEWRDGCVYKTRSLGCGWFLEDDIKANTDPNIMYVAASDEYAKTHSSVRKAPDAAQETALQESLVRHPSSRKYRRQQ